MVNLRLASLTDKLEHSYWKMVKQDYCDYYFFIYDWLLQREKTKVVLALEQDAIVGAMVIYDESIVQVRGEPEAVRTLLGILELKKVDVQAPANCEGILLETFPSFRQKESVVLMTLGRGQERLNVKVKPTVLGPSDAEEIALLMKQSYPEMWSEISAEQVGNMFSADYACWLGIKQQGRLVSFGYATLTPQVSHVTWIATSEQWRNKGYASSIVSALVKECLNKASTAMIYVMDNNKMAKGIYARVGFKPYKSYTFLRT